MVLTKDDVPVIRSHMFFFKLYTQLDNLKDSYFEVNIYHLFTNMLFAYTNFISCQATHSYSYLLESRI